MADAMLDQCMRSTDHLHSLLSTSFGPLPGEKLLLTATGKAIFTCSGPSILTAAVNSDVAQGLVVQAAQAHAAHVGDGTKCFVLMLSAALGEVERQQRGLPDVRRYAWRLRLSKSVCRRCCRACCTHAYARRRARRQARTPPRSAPTRRTLPRPPLAATWA